MSTRPPLSTAEADLAADFALGQLDGAAHANAVRLMREHPGFRAEVARWSTVLVPLFDEVEAREPPAGLYEGIERQLGPSAANDDAPLRTRLRRWQWFGGGMSALAAALALVLVTAQPPAPIPPPEPSSPMVAAIAGEGPGRMVAMWNGTERSLMVAATAPMPDDPGHAHELWLIPADGKPRSMGVMPKGTMRATVPMPMAAQFAEGATLAISVEPMDGSPTGLPTGPVVASGTLRAT
jgi:anti-sigma-K factor RskA